MRLDTEVLDGDLGFGGPEVLADEEAIGGGKGGKRGGKGQTHLFLRRIYFSGCTALVLAVLTQFFFTKAGSMAEPL